MTTRATVVVLAGLASLAILHDLLALVLDRAGLVEQLLSPYEASAVIALIAALVLFALRLGLVLLGPALALALLGDRALALGAWLSERGRPASGLPPGARDDRDPRADRPWGDPRPPPPRSSSATRGVASR